MMSNETSDLASALPAGEGQIRILVAAGGTGGHLFPAEALAAALAKKNAVVALATDDRAARHAGSFAKGGIHIIPSATIVSRNPLALARSATLLGFGVLKAWSKLPRISPAAVVGFGGYPSVPPLLAAILRRTPTVIHEQNAVMGRANRLLAPYVSAIATGFSGVLDRDTALAAKTIHTGNPVRPAVIAAASTPYPVVNASEKIQLLVFGGSQGARIMADIVPAAVERLEPRLQIRLKLVQQARDEDAVRVRDAYAKLGVEAEIEPFFKDLPARMAACHLVVSRSGASTIAELTAIGRPGILVPLPHSLDQDQHHNAGVLMAAGGAIRLPQSEFTPNRLAAEIAALAGEPQRLAAMAAAAKAIGTLDAADRLADLVLRVAGVIPR